MSQVPRMFRARMLFTIRIAHTLIYLIMATSVVFIFLSAIDGYRGPPLVVALVLVGIEVAVFTASGMRCPLTGLAQRYGAEKGYVFDTFLPEAFTKYTFRFFGSLLAIGLVGLALRLFLH